MNSIFILIERKKSTQTQKSTTINNDQQRQSILNIEDDDSNFMDFDKPTNNTNYFVKNDSVQTGANNANKHITTYSNKSGSSSVANCLIKDRNLIDNTNYFSNINKKKYD
jgi:predicted RNA-binding Zn ribbon-like protein